MFNFLKLSAQVGQTVFTTGPKGKVVRLTKNQMLLRTGYNGTCVWMNRSQLKGFVK